MLRIPDVKQRSGESDATRQTRSQGSTQRLSVPARNAVPNLGATYGRAAAIDANTGRNILNAVTGVAVAAYERHEGMKRVADDAKLKTAASDAKDILDTTQDEMNTNRRENDIDPEAADIDYLNNRDTRFEELTATTTFATKEAGEKFKTFVGELKTLDDKAQQSRLDNFYLEDTKNAWVKIRAGNEKRAVKTDSLETVIDGLNDELDFQQQRFETDFSMAPEQNQKNKSELVNSRMKLFVDGRLQAINNNPALSLDEKMNNAASLLTMYDSLPEHLQQYVDVDDLLAHTESITKDMHAFDSAIAKQNKAAFDAIQDNNAVKVTEYLTGFRAKEDTFEDPDKHVVASLRDMLNKNEITDTFYKSSLEKLKRKDEKLTSSQNLLDIVDTAITAGKNLNPKDKLHLKAADEKYKTVMANTPQDETPLATANRLSTMMNDTGVIPKQFVIDNARLIATGDEQDEILGSVMFSAAMQNPKLRKQLLNKDGVGAEFTRDQRIQVNMVNNKASHKDAFITAESIKNMTQEDLIHREQTFLKQYPKATAKSGSTNLNVWLDNNLELEFEERFDQWGGDDIPPATKPMLQDMEFQAMSYYLASGNMDTAKQLAFEDVTNKYSMTNINGVPQWMNGAIDDQYPELTANEIRTQFVKTMQDAGYKDDTYRAAYGGGKKINGRNVVAVEIINPTTGLYNALIVDGEDEKTRQMLFAPDVTQSEAKNEAAQVGDEFIENRNKKAAFDAAIIKQREYEKQLYLQRRARVENKNKEQ